MKITLISLLLIINTITCFAQKEFNIWYFGDKIGLDFNSGTPEILTDSEMFAGEGCSSVSDADGALLFYTNGLSIYRKDHFVMTNGSGLAGHESSSQAAHIVKKPGVNNIYYVFTTDGIFDYKGLAYSIVDMSMNDGFGEVTDKNILIAEKTCEKVTSTCHANKEDMWILTHKRDSDAFIAFLLTADGISMTVFSNVGDYVDSEGDLYSAAHGEMKISPSGDKLIIANFYHQNQLLDFDNTTGLLSNPLTLIEPDTTDGPGFKSPFGCEFSPSSTKVYFSNFSHLGTDDEIIQFDLTADDIVGSRSNIGASLDYVLAGMQLAPDGKIYIARHNSNYLSVINDPDNDGLDCNFEELAVDLGTGVCKLALPSHNIKIFPDFGAAIKEYQTVQNVQLSFSPNPFEASSTITLDGLDQHEKYIIKIMTLTGKIVHLEPMNGTTSSLIFDRSNLSNGMYLAVVQDSNENIVAQSKMIIQ
ncbi:MAG: T9SS type A sorting domain-containing protein [Crocinitomix sp.]|nr:T9SS type A sorting domain-containing protein [Crocinitomix sp.]